MGRRTTTPRNFAFSTISQVMGAGDDDEEERSKASSMGEDGDSSTTTSQGGQSGLASSHSGGNHMNGADAESVYFGHHESRRVRGMRVMVFMLLLLVAIAVSLTMYFITDASQQTEFEVR